MRIEVNEKCPVCGVDAGMPRAGESEDVFPCTACGVSLVIKAAVFEDPVRVWVATVEAERAALDAVKRAIKAMGDEG